jgi:hypothetical protein
MQLHCNVIVVHVTTIIHVFSMLEIVAKSKSVTLRPTISRPACLGVRRPPGTRDQFFFLLEISFTQLLCYFVAPSLTRVRVCNLQ